MSEKTIGVLIHVYCIMALLTFGYATNENWQKMPEDSAFATKSDEYLVNLIGGGLCGMVWPLYLSYKLFEPKGGH